MSELDLDAFVHMEFESRVYLGEKDGYSDSVLHVSAASPINLRPLVKRVRTYEQGVVLVMQSGYAVYVAYSNIRYVYFGLCEPPTENDEPGIGSGEKKHNEPLDEVAQKTNEIMGAMRKREADALLADQGPWTGQVTSGQPLPKRRGRPPKVRPEPGETNGE